ncbi:hypothetical protein J7297_00010 [Nakaseomyces glabratus]|nr:hypothetical protein J7297_00010 [Nakaseomyces glabratus]KAH7598783.1 hypothetical protein J7296_00004 [Nakaseomyces glabratus]KAI8400953.1 hypothetical protein J6895_00002 [Nakaseomyces glabratus]
MRKIKRLESFSQIFGRLMNLILTKEHSTKLHWNITTYMDNYLIKKEYNNKENMKPNFICFKIVFLLSKNL